MVQRAEDAGQQEAAAWQVRTRLEALSVRTAQLEAEREAEAFQRTILLRERQALVEENERLRAAAAELAQRLDQSQMAREAARDQVTFLQRQIRTRFVAQDRIKKERAGLSRLLGRTVSGLLGLGSGQRPSRRALAAATKALLRIDLVDGPWYKTRYPDVAASGMDPVRHYLCHGSQEGRDPRDPAEE